MTYNTYRCLDCNQITTKRELDRHKSRCYLCNYSIIINVRNGKIWLVNSNQYMENPILLLNEQEKFLNPDNYIITSKYQDEFFITDSEKRNFREGGLFNPLVDFDIKLLRKIIKRIEKLKDMKLPLRMLKKIR